MCENMVPAYASLTEEESETEAAIFTYAKPKDEGFYDLKLSLTKSSEVPSEETESELKDETIQVDYRGAISDDVTGNWRLSFVSTEKEIGDYALNFAEEFLTSSDEIHAIINTTRMETYRIKEVLSNTISISVFEYVDSEEHSAKTLFGGNLLKDYWLYTDTGEIEDIMNEE